MKGDELRQLLGLGKATAISLDPDMKGDITRTQMDALVRDAKKHLSLGRKAHLILIRQ